MIRAGVIDYKRFAIGRLCVRSSDVLPHFQPRIQITLQLPRSLNLSAELDWQCWSRTELKISPVREPYFSRFAAPTRPVID